MPPSLPTRLVILGVMAMLAGCNLSKLFESSGAACASDVNCPSPQVCCNGSCAERCDRPNTLVASAVFSTDYVPGYELDEIDVDLDGNQRVIDVNAVTELVNPRPISQFTEVAPGNHVMTVRLLFNNAIVASRVVSFFLNTDITVPVIITRDCSRATCDSPGAEQCAGGRCVNAKCSDLSPEACPSPECAVDDDCPSSVGCTQPICVSGLCLERRDDTLCGSDERCMPGLGCMVAHHECDVESQCDDLTSCTQERCTDGRCTATRDDTRCGLTVCDPTAKTANPDSGCTPAPCSADNCLAASCETASCVDGICVHTPVCQSGEQCCDGVCALNCNDPRACAGRPSGYVCRVAVGACDLPETCDGVSESCPPDVRQSGGTVCRATAGDCDIEERCDGQSPLCPTNAVASSGTVCRAKNGACDVAEACTGLSSACPVDVFVPADTVCRAASGVCDVDEVCTGTGPACPANAFLPSATTCRDSGGPCDVAERCTGNNADCPGNTFLSASTVCRAQAAGTNCDVAENCTGSSAACPGDGFRAAGTVCRPGAGPCDVQETCTGSGAACPNDGFASTSVQCRGSQGPCDRVEYCPGNSAGCPGDAFVAGGTQCNPASGDPCDVADVCPGNGPSCPNAAQPAGTLCGAAPNVCYQNRYCNGSPSCPGWSPAPHGTYYGELDTCRYYICDGAFNVAIAPRNDGAVCSDTGATCVYYVCSGGSCGAAVARNSGAACNGATCAICQGTSCAGDYCEYYGGYPWQCYTPYGYPAGSGGCVYIDPGGGGYLQP